MAKKELNARDAKLVQYLNEAYGKERELEVSLAAHIEMTPKDTYRKRLKEHLRETSRHKKAVEKRIKQLGGTPEQIDLPGPDIVGDAATSVVGVAKAGMALAKGQLHAIRGSGEAEKMLKNAKTEYFNEFEEIATYRAIETFATAVGDKETARLAKSIIREEERMAKFLERLIPQLAKSVVKDEVPASERGTSRRRSASSRSRSSSASSRSSSSTSRRSSASKAKRSVAASKGSTKRKAKATAASAKRTATQARSTAKGAAKTARSTAKSGAKRTTSRAKSAANGASASSSRSKSSKRSSNGSSRTKARSGSRSK